ncbi:hypothetical protein FA13DRAFT_1414772 [Coprinellus micaceus]|uniref:Uncharacterized protein n=1 Tax=Coprinellus micaceus TaxID=71717 RepID=A0A4Y7SP37_COPMI|nr:hypothetical protein FA13DRAFT_1414772 [Coprinellus micaceus]
MSPSLSRAPLSISEYRSTSPIVRLSKLTCRLNQPPEPRRQLWLYASPCAEDPGLDLRRIRQNAAGSKGRKEEGQEAKEGARRAAVSKPHSAPRALSGSQLAIARPSAERLHCGLSNTPANNPVFERNSPSGRRTIRGRRCKRVIWGRVRT